MPWGLCMKARFSTSTFPLWSMGVGLILLLGAYLTNGPVEAGLTEWIGALWHPFGGAVNTPNPALGTILWEIRMPRALLAILVGTALAAAGSVLQSLFRNPLADPGLIGVSSGGAVGTMMALLSVSSWSSGAQLGFLQIYPPLMAMTGSLCTAWLVYRVARISGRTHVSTLLLAGIAINAFAGALIGGMLYISDSEIIRQFTFWTLGSLSGASVSSLLLIAPFVVIPLVLLPRERRALNAFLLGEAEAYHLGFDTQRVKVRVLLLCSAMVGATVAFCGLIGFVGLVVPHIARLWVGPDLRRMFPLACLLGACLILAADMAARTLNAPSEIPIGILTALLGAPFFLYLVHKRKSSVA